jgi:hypothetical protein
VRSVKFPPKQLDLRTCVAGMLVLKLVTLLFVCQFYTLGKTSMFSFLEVSHLASQGHDEI